MTAPDYERLAGDFVRAHDERDEAALQRLDIDWTAKPRRRFLEVLDITPRESELTC
jgi:hypothetical protein